MKKFAAFLMSFALLAATASNTVLAESVLPDTPTTGTLTLEKYEPTTPEKQKPVSGAEFTAYQVVDLTNGTYKVTKNFEDVQDLKDLLSEDEYVNGEGGLTYASTEEFEKLIPALQEAADGKTDNAADGHVYESTEGSADNAGKYTFGDMAIGIYLVVETKLPANYTAASKSFLVSIPEWDQDSETWNYDITAYPKNAPMTLEKNIKNEEDNKVSEDSKIEK